MRNQTLMSRQFEYFAVLYRTRRYAAAAKAIPISYQGLRKSIAKLEAELDAPLFEARGNDADLEPTEAADLLYDLLLKWTEDANELEKALRETGPDAVRTVGLCAAIGSLSILGYSPIYKLEDEHRNLRVAVTEASDDLADDYLLRGEYGIGLTVSPFDESLITQPILSIGCAAYVSKSHPLAQKNALTLRDLAGQNILLPDRRYKANHCLRAAMRDQGVRPNKVSECPDPFWSLSFAEEGRGIGIFMQNPFGLVEDAPGARLMPISDGYVYTIGLSHRRGHVLTAEEKALWAYFEQAASQSGART